MNSARKSEFTLRPAISADAPALTSLRNAFWADQISKGSLDSPNLELPQLLTDTSRLIDRTRTVLLIVADGEKHAGYLYGQVKMLPGSAAPVGSVEEIFVASEYRRANMAQSLVGEAIAQLQTFGARRIQLRVLQDNGEGRIFWQRLGFSPSVTIYEYAEISTPRS